MNPATELHWIGASSANAANRIEEVAETTGREIVALVDGHGSAVAWADERRTGPIAEALGAAEDRDYRRAELYRSVGDILVGIADYGDYEEHGASVRRALIEVVADTYHDGKVNEALNKIEEGY
jgi:hypothetical protein